MSFEQTADRSARAALTRLGLPALLRRRGTLDDVEITALRALGVERDDGGGQPIRVDEITVLVAEVSSIARGDLITIYPSSEARSTRTGGATYSADALARAGTSVLVWRVLRTTNV